MMIDVSARAMRGWPAAWRIAATLALGAVAASGATYQWNGSNSTVWTAAGNWQPTGGGITAGPGPTGGAFNHRLNVNNAARNELLYDASLGDTVYAGADRGLVVGSGSSGSGRMRITGGTFSTVGSPGPDVLGNGAGNTGQLTVAGGNYVSAGPGLVVGFGSGGAGVLAVQGGTATVSLLTFNSGGTVHLDGGALAVSGIVRTAGTALFNFNGGTLLPRAGTGNFLTGATRANVRNGGAVIDTAGFNVTVAPPLEHSNIPGDAEVDGGLIKNGAGVLTLTNINTFTGPTTVNRGTLLIYGSIGAGAVTVAAGASFGGATVGGSVTTAGGSTLLPGAGAGAGSLAIGGSLLLAGSDTVRVDVAPGPALDKIVVAGDLAPGGVTAIELAGDLGALVAGSYPVAEVSGSLLGDATNFLVATASPVGRFHFGLSYETGSVPNRLVLNVSGSPSNLVWKGSSSQWDVGLIESWLSGGADDFFYDGDFVTFNAAGVAQPNVDLAQPVSPGSVTVDTSGGDYAFSSTSGSGIAGAGALTKDGAGTLTVGTTNTYTGGTIVNGGSLDTGNPGGLGSGPVTVNGEGTVNLTGGGVIYTALGKGLAGSGTVNVTLGVGLATTPLNGTNTGFSGTLNVGVGAGAGAGKIQLHGPLAPTATLNVLTNGTVYVGTAVTHSNAIVLYGGDTGEALGQLRLDSGATWAGPVTIAGPIAGTNDGHIGAFGGTGTVSGSIGEAGGSQSLVKAGGADTVLAGTNTYSGETVILGGRLIVARGSDVLGDTTGGTYVTNNASLGLAGGIAYDPAEALRISGYGIGFRGALQSVSGSNMWPGNIVIPAAGTGARFGVQDDAQLTLSGNITEVQPGTTVIFRHGNTAGSDVTISGTGNVWSGETQIFGGGGAVKLGADNALPTGVLLRVGTSGIPGSSVLDLNGFNQAAAGLNRVLEGPAYVINNGSQPSTLTLNPSVTIAYYGSINDGASPVHVVKEGPATQQFFGEVSYTGDTTVRGGILSFASTSSWQGVGGRFVVDGGTCDLAGGSREVTLSPSAGVHFGPGGGVLTLNSVTFRQLASGSRLNFATAGGAPGLVTGSIDSDDDTVVFDVSAGAGPVDLLVGGSIWNGGSVVKTGGGVLELPATNTYSGPTVVSNGTLLVNGSLAAGGVALEPAGTLGGTGVVGGAVVAEGTIAPGASAGTLTIVGNLDLLAGATLAIELGGAAQGLEYDLLAVQGDVTLGGSLTVSVVNGFEATLAPGDLFTVLASTSPIGGAFDNVAPGGTLVAGSQAFRVYYGPSSGFGNAVVVLEAAGEPTGGYDDWSARHGLVEGPEGDDDGDGCANLLEYATGGDPATADSVARLGAARTNGLFAARFTRDTNSVDTTIRVEGSASMSAGALWTGIATNIAGSWGGAGNVNETGAGSPVFVVVGDAAAASTNRFLRLRVTRP
jgi:fibronectin-binding autotransporter adhesin